jgi:hypothetical protein
MQLTVEDQTFGQIIVFFTKTVAALSINGSVMKILACVKLFSVKMLLVFLLPGSLVSL